jgi:hypothetical protein
MPNTATRPSSRVSFWPQSADAERQATAEHRPQKYTEKHGQT